MRAAAILATVSALAATVVATPTPTPYGGARRGWRSGWRNVFGKPGAWHPGKDGADVCLTDEDATAAADVFRQLIQAYTPALALEALTEDFVDWTSAVNIIRNRGAELPFITNSVSFGSRAQFMAAQGSQPPIPFDTLNVFHGCNTTTVRWQTTRSANGQKTETADIPVVGLAVLETVPDSDNSYGFRVKNLFSEFNAAAWLVNNGVFKPNGTVTPVGVDPTPSPRSAKRDLEGNHLRGPAI